MSHGHAGMVAGSHPLWPPDPRQRADVHAPVRGKGAPGRLVRDRGLTAHCGHMSSGHLPPGDPPQLLSGTGREAAEQRGPHPDRR